MVFFSLEPVCCLVVCSVRSSYTVLNRIRWPCPSRPSVTPSQLNRRRLWFFFLVFFTEFSTASLPSFVSRRACGLVQLFCPRWFIRLYRILLGFSLFQPGFLYQNKNKTDRTTLEVGLPRFALISSLGSLFRVEFLSGNEWHFGTVFSCLLEQVEQEEAAEAPLSYAMDGQPHANDNTTEVPNDPGSVPQSLVFCFGSFFCLGKKTASVVLTPAKPRPKTPSLSISSSETPRRPPRREKKTMECAVGWERCSCSLEICTEEFDDTRDEKRYKRDSCISVAMATVAPPPPPPRRGRSQLGRNYRSHRHVFVFIFFIWIVSWRVSAFFIGTRNIFGPIAEWGKDNRNPR